MLIPIILSGGVGARLWPVSRESSPKPFIRLADGKSLLQKAFERALAVAGTGPVLTVTNHEYVHATRDEYRAVYADARSTLILEPCARNTAPAITLAALYAQKHHGPDVLLLVLPADHVVTPVDRFGAAVEAARSLAATGRIVVFGVTLAHAETAYGYIECGAAIDGKSSQVACFVEKPDLDRARQFVASGRHLWNSGMFCFSTQTLLQNVKQHAPEIYTAASRCFDLTQAQSGDVFTLDAGSFSAVPAVSIDYAVMEKAENVAVVRADFAWSDVGSWNAVSELTTPDASGNRIVGESVMLDSSGCYVQSADRVIAGIGLRDLLIVDTPDALLIADRGKAQEVRAVTEQLKIAGHTAHKIHRTVNRPWGSYTLLEQGPGYKLKRIVVNPGASLSLQMHHHRSEHWVVIAGVATVVNGERQLLLQTNESTFVPAETKHRLSNAGTTPLAIIEVQTGDYVEEDDIVRFDDVYGRR